MEKQKGSDGSQNPHLWKQALEEISSRTGNEIYIREVYEARCRYNAGEDKEEIFPVKIDSVKTLIKTEVGPKDPIIKGPVEIAKGKKLILGITPDQEDAFAIIYNMDLDSEVSYYAQVQNVAGETHGEEVLIKYCDIMLASVNHLVVSEALAKKLNVKRGEDIKILSLHQKTSDVNLDNI